jgi:hypothetical protein
MAGEKRRPFLPTPDELRRDYGDSAPLAASVFGALRPLVYLILAIVAICAVVIVLLGDGNGSGFAGWAILLLGIDITGAALLISALALRRGRQISSLRQDQRR